MIRGNPLWKPNAFGGRPGSARNGTRAAALLALVATGLSACSSSNHSTAASSVGSASKSPYVVAMVADMTGAASTIEGAPSAAGLQTFAHQINASGGINGHPINVHVFDAQSSATDVGSALLQAVQSKPVVIFNAVLTSELAAELPTLKSSAIPLYTAASLDQELFPSPQPWYFSFGSTQGQSARYFVNEAEQLLGGSLQGKKLGIEAIGTSGVDQTVANLKQLIENSGGTVVTVQRSSASGVTSFASQAQNMVQAAPDAIMIQDSSSNTAVIAQALATAGFTKPIIAGEGANDEALFQKLSLSNYYAVRTNLAATAGTSLNAAAQQAGQPTSGGFFGIGWSMGDIFSHAAAKCGFPCSASAFESATEDLGPTTVSDNALFGPVEFSSSRHYALTKFQYYVWSPSQQKTTPAGNPLDLTNGSPIVVSS